MSGYLTDNFHIAGCEESAEVIAANPADNTLQKSVNNQQAHSTRI